VARAVFAYFSSVRQLRQAKRGKAGSILGGTRREELRAIKSIRKTAKTGINGEKRAENGSENRPKTVKNRCGLPAGLRLSGIAGRRE